MLSLVGRVGRGKGRDKRKEVGGKEGDRGRDREGAKEGEGGGGGHASCPGPLQRDRAEHWAVAPPSGRGWD